MESLECVRVLEGHNEAVLALAVGPTFLVSGSYDTTVRFWGLDTLRCIRCANSAFLQSPIIACTAVMCRPSVNIWRASTRCAASGTQHSCHLSLCMPFFHIAPPLQSVLNVRMHIGPCA